MHIRTIAVTVLVYGMVLCAAICVALSSPAAAASAYEEVPTDHWTCAALDCVERIRVFDPRVDRFTKGYSKSERELARHEFVFKVVLPSEWTWPATREPDMYDLDLHELITLEYKYYVLVLQQEFSGQEEGYYINGGEDLLARFNVALLIDRWLSSNHERPLKKITDMLLTEALWQEFSDQLSQMNDFQLYQPEDSLAEQNQTE